ncbi:MAG: SWIM zinc finger family protein [Anaerolineae bacterium]|nr:SWIM zinc finger family protein [Anaerolineae bacterium]
MTNALNLTEKQIRDRADSNSFAKGQSYYKGGAISDMVLRGDRLEGLCEGSQPSPYRVLIKFDEDGIADASCTCPYDWGGDCKHIVALLLNYLNEPEKFEERASPDDTLKERSKEELIALIREMIERQPDLEALIHRPMPGHRPRATPVDTESYRKELSYALDGYDEWDASPSFQAVSSVAHTAEEFGKHGDWPSARAIYSTILEEGLDADDYLYDGYSGLDVALGEAIDGLIECLKQSAITDDNNERQAALDSLLDVYIKDIDMGGIGLADEVPDAIFEHTRPEDIAAIRSRVETAQKKKVTSDYGRWAVEAYAGFLAELDAIDNVDVDVVIERLRGQGLYELVFRKLIQLGRLDEAIAVTEEHLTQSYERLRAVTALSEQGREEQAIRLAEQTLRQGHDHNLAQWLLDRYKERKDSQARLQLLQQCMVRFPSLPYYIELETEAKALKQWSDLRPPLIEALKAAKQDNLLVHIYLHDQEWDRAWEIVDNLAASERKVGSFHYHSRLDLEVAEASRSARPRKAIPVYIKYAQKGIAGRSRQTYAEAARYLAVVKQLYEKIGDMSAWNSLIAGIREEFKRLPALQDELRKAGL